MDFALRARVDFFLRAPLELRALQKYHKGNTSWFHAGTSASDTGISSSSALKLCVWICFTGAGRFPVAGNIEIAGVRGGCFSG
jgi:hypothetical protein